MTNYIFGLTNYHVFYDYTCDWLMEIMDHIIINLKLWLLIDEYTVINYCSNLAQNWFQLAKLGENLYHYFIEIKYSFAICIPKGIMVRVMGTVSKAFLPYLSERLPTRGIITSDPNPMICINRIFLLCIWAISEH